MTLDISKTVEPRSDQLNFDDVQTHPLVITITEVKQGPPDQPVHLHNAEFPGRPYKPGKSMRRVLIAAWGTDASVYVGKKIALYGDPKIKFGRDEVGGIRIGALSHIDKPLTVALTVTRGRREPFQVAQLPAGPGPEEVAAAIADMQGASTLEVLLVAWSLAAKRGVQGHPDVVAAKDARKAQLEQVDDSPSALTGRSE